jgi:hypothetical protein
LQSTRERNEDFLLLLLLSMAHGVNKNEAFFLREMGMLGIFLSVCFIISLLSFLLLFSSLVSLCRGREGLKEERGGLSRLFLPRSRPPPPPLSLKMMRKCTKRFELPTNGRSWQEMGKMKSLLCLFVVLVSCSSCSSCSPFEAWKQTYTRCPLFAGSMGRRRFCSAYLGLGHYHHYHYYYYYYYYHHHHQHY